MGYDVWDIGTGNLIFTCDVEDEALAFVREAVKEFGKRYVSQWALQCIDDQGKISLVAQGAALATRAAIAVPA